ncbi:MAG: metallophosphoesterase [Brumimicrobium sp.]
MQASKKPIIQYCSDLHLEFLMNKRLLLENPIQPVGDILILAGDVIPFIEIEKHNDFFDYVSQNFKEVYWIPGNHEYYQYDISKRKGSFKIKVRPNVTLLNNSTIVIYNFKLIFSTLWTFVPPLEMRVVQNSMNDYHLINYENQIFTPEISNELFEENFAFIGEELSKNDGLQQFVITHHVPTFKNYPQEFIESAITSAFAVDLNKFIEKSTIHSWIYGHHHRNVKDFKIGNTNMLTNQLGYVQLGEQQKFDAKKVITI